MSFPYEEWNGCEETLALEIEVGRIESNTMS
jgi:hypothetical protein